MSYLLIGLAVFISLIIIIRGIPVVFVPHLQVKAIRRQRLSDTHVDSTFVKAINADRKGQSIAEVRWTILLMGFIGAAAIAGSAAILYRSAIITTGIPAELVHAISVLGASISTFILVAGAVASFGGAPLFNAISSLRLATLKSDEKAEARKRFTADIPSAETAHNDHRQDAQRNRRNARTSQNDHPARGSFGVVAATGVAVGAISGWAFTRRRR